MFYGLQKEEIQLSPPCNVVPLFQLPIENTPTLNGGDRGGVRILLFCEVTLFTYNVSTILSPIEALIHVHSQHVHVRSTSVSHSILYVISQTKMIQKTAGNLRCHCWFPCKIKSVKLAQKIHTDNICHLVIQLYMTNLCTQIGVVL